MNVHVYIYWYKIYDILMTRLENRPFSISVWRKCLEIRRNGGAYKHSAFQEYIVG